MFERLNSTSTSLNLDDYNRMVERLERQQFGRSASAPGIDGAAGIGQLPRADVHRCFWIQVSAVHTSSSFTGGVEVVSAYDWSEVVRLDGRFSTPGDGRSATAANFPAFEMSGRSTVPLNAGSTTKAYLAWISWDERSIEFIGIDPAADVSGNAGPGTVPTGFNGVRVRRLTSYGPLFARAYIPFDDERWDTNSYHTNAAGSNTRLQIDPLSPAGTYYCWVGAQVWVLGASSGITATAEIWMNQVSQLASVEGTDTPTPGNVFLNLNTLYALTPGDYVELVVAPTPNSTVIGAADAPDTGNHGTEFWLQLAGFVP